LLPETSLQIAEQIAERIREGVQRLDVRCSKDTKVDVTITLGVAQRKENESFDSMLARADGARYEGKTSGRNRTIAAV